MSPLTKIRKQFFVSETKIKELFKKVDLKHVTLNCFKTYIRDPSNKNEKFLRVRIRKYRSNMEKEGLGTGKIIKNVNNLLSASKALDFYKNKAYISMHLLCQKINV